MIKGISYEITVAKLGYSYSDFEFTNRKLELIPNIIMDVTYQDLEIIRDIKINYTPSNGFIVGLNSIELSFEKIMELEKYINQNKQFQEDFEEFMNEVRGLRKVGFSIEKNNV